MFAQTVKLEEMEKKAGNAEGDVSSLRFNFTMNIAVVVSAFIVIAIMSMQIIKILIPIVFRSRLILLQENNEKQEDRLAKVKKQIFKLTSLLVISFFLACDPYSNMKSVFCDPCSHVKSALRPPSSWRERA